MDEAQIASLTNGILADLSRLRESLHQPQEPIDETTRRRRIMPR